MTRPTKGERREKKQRSRKKMKVDGRSILTLAEMTRQKAKKARARNKEWGDPNYESADNSES